MTTHNKGFLVAQSGFKIGNQDSSVLVNGAGSVVGSQTGITVGAEAATVINVSVQFKDALGSAVSSPVYAHIIFTDDAAGQTVATTAIDTVAVGTNGWVVEAITAGKEYRVVSEATGIFDLDLTQNAADTLYMQIVGPDNALITSGVITWAGP